MEKKILFGDLVRNSGRPQTVTLWTDRKKDKGLAKAIKENRVLTVTQEPTSKRKDFGRIGFHEEPHSAYLAFPRALPRETEARVIGINYQLVEEPEVSDQAGKVSAKAKPKPVKTKPVEKKFHVRVRRMATVERNFQVPAEDRAAAERKAVELARAEPFEVTKARMNEEIVRAE